MKEVTLYFKYIKLHLLSGLEYKGWWIMVLQVLLNCILDPLGTVLMFLRFGSIGPWSAERIMLIYAMAVTSYGLAETFFRGFDYFPHKMIQSGDFDRLLLRPKTLFTQAAASYFHIHRVARPIAGLAIIVWSLWRQGIVPSTLRMMILAMALLGGMVTYAGVFVMTSGIAFFTVKALDWIVVFTNASYQVARIPVDYMPPALRHMFTFFMPMLVVSYYPASVICNWGEPLWKGLLALPAGFAFLGASMIVWRFGIKRYKSTGS